MKRMLESAAMSLAIVVSALGSHGAERVKIAENGRAKAVIVIADKSTKGAWFGARELKTHLDAITGADFKLLTESQLSSTNSPLSSTLSPLPTPIFVGCSSRTRAKSGDFKPQQYRVEIRPDAIELVGFDGDDYKHRDVPGLYDPIGSAYAVFEFLERECGVEWVDASDYGTILKRDANLSVAVGVRNYRPFMDYRGGTIEYGMDPTYWRGNTPEFKAYRVAAFGTKKDAEINNCFRRFQLRQRVGGIYARANHSFYWMYDFFWRKNSKRFKEFRPEFFAQGHDGEPPQLCYSNPQTIDFIVQQVRGYFDATVQTNAYGGVFIHGGGTWVKSWGNDHCCLEPMDNTCFCMCPACSKLFEPQRAADNSAHSTYWFTFVDKVAREVKKTHPDKKITTLAYMSHEGLPTGLKLSDNIEVLFCVSDNRDNPRGELCQAQFKRMTEWHAAYPQMRLGVWFYGGFPLEFAHNGNYHCLPGYFAHEAAKQYRFLKSVNASLGNCNCGLNGSVCQFMAYQLMRNPDLEADGLLDRYFAQYGAAAKPLRKFYAIVEERFCDLKYRPKNVTSRSPEASWKWRCPPEVVAELGGLVAEAKRLAQTPEEQARVKIFEISEWLWIKQGSEAYLTRMQAPMPAWTATRIAEAGGDLAKVAWEKLPLVKAPIYLKGGAIEAKPEVLGFEARLAHDGKYFYLELVQIRDVEKIVVSGHINPCDDWEMIASRQRAQPYRCYFSDCESRMFGASYGEVNWRQDVPSSESHNDPAFFAKVKSTLVKPNRWVQHFAFPLDRFLDQPIRPGDTFYLNPITVINGKASQCRGLGIFSPVSHSTVHTCDRSAAVTLEK